MTDNASSADANATVSISAGRLPDWTVGELPAPPGMGLRSWMALIGPGLLMAGVAIGAGEWIFGPAVTGQYDATLLWLATISFVCQLFINIEVMRYALYCGEPIYVGYLRSWPGPVPGNPRKFSRTTGFTPSRTSCQENAPFLAIWPEI